MAGFTKADRQRIIDGYLNESGANAFVPAEFLEWLRERPEHVAYEIFYGIDDAEAAMAYRIDMARSWASGLRITVQAQSARQSRVEGVKVQDYRLPAMISPMAGRKNGGGYVAVDPEDPAIMAELRMQAARDLASWIERYGDLLALAGGRVAPLTEIVGLLNAVDVVEAA